MVGHSGSAVGEAMQYIRQTASSGQVSANQCHEAASNHTPSVVLAVLVVLMGRDKSNQRSLKVGGTGGSFICQK
jgi:hypothetical protein